MTDQSTTSSAEPAINMNTNMNTNISSGDRYTMEEIVPLSLSSQEHKLHVHGANGNESLFSDIEEAPQNSYQYGHTPNHDTFLSSYLPAKYLDRLYPTNVPRSVQLLRQENMAIPACYLCVGILQGLSGPFINVYPLFLGATEAQQTTISSIRSLPASFKILFGFFSDNVPFMGYRRKSYMVIGWAMSSLSMVFLMMFSNLQRIQVNQLDANGDYKDDKSYDNLQPADDAPSVPFLTFTLLMFGTGFWLSDVMVDSLVAVKAKLEPIQSRGQLQSTCYACRFFGLMVAAPISTVLYSKYGPEVIIKLMAIVPMMMLYPIYHLYELKHAEIKSTRSQCQEIWNTVCSRAVWQPMAFVYIYNVLQIGNAAWKEFLKSVLFFQDWQLNTLVVIANVLLYCGVMAYKYYFIRFSWRSIYIGTTLLNMVLSLLQLLLIQGITFGLSPFVFALGDDIFADFIAGVQFLPTTIMMVHLCPAGSEGASYAMFTTVSNCASGLASALSTVLTRFWNVKKETMVGGDLSGLTKLALLTTGLQTSGLLFVKMLPKTKNDLSELHNSAYSGSRMGGAIFLTITISSVLYAVIVSLLNIVAPGWAGES